MFKCRIERAWESLSNISRGRKYEKIAIYEKLIDTKLYVIEVSVKIMKLLCDLNSR